MFRKNFREGGGGGKSGGGGCGGGGGLKGSKSFSSGRNANKQRARDMSLSLQDDVHYRTHLFFSPSNRPCYTDNEGERIWKQREGETEWWEEGDEMDDAFSSVAISSFESSFILAPSQWTFEVQQKVLQIVRLSN